LDQIKDVLISISTKLLDSPTAEMDEVIIDVLDECRQCLGVDRMSCLPLDHAIVENWRHYESLGKGIPSVQKEIPASVVLEYRSLIEKGEVVCSDSSPNLLALADKLQPETPLRHVLVPISAMGKPWGLLACANFVSETRFDDDFIHSSTLLGNIIASSIARVNHYEQLKRSQQEIAARNRRIIGERERERRNIARDLHDDFSQRLASLGIEMGLAASMCDAQSGQVIAKCAKGLAEITRDIQQLSRHLHPVVIERVGLHTAIESHIKQVASRSDLIAEIRLDRNIEFDDDTALHIYRIIQESLSNVVKHASAQNINVTLRKFDQGIELVIEDDGVGFLPLGVDMNAPSLGLQSMVERGEIIGGTVTLDSSPTLSGARVKLQINRHEDYVWRQ
jgi:signal transduction histidine kinase